MAEPKIVFCPKNHIYDAAIHLECPYCRKIAVEQSELSKTLGNLQINSKEKFKNLDEDVATELLNREIDGNDDRTELLQSDDEKNTELLSVTREDKDDYTEILNRSTDENDSTELISDYSSKEDGREFYQFDKSFSKKRGMNDPIENINNKTKQYAESEQNQILNRPVYGWIVCNYGKIEGQSLEISSGLNYLIEDPQKYWVSNVADKTENQLARIIHKKRGFTIEPAKGVICKINGTISKKSELKNYDVISLGEAEFVFVELMTAFVKWGT